MPLPVRRNIGTRFRDVKPRGNERAVDNNELAGLIATVLSGGQGINVKRLGQMVVIEGIAKPSGVRASGGNVCITTTGQTLSTGAGSRGQCGITNLNSTTFPEVYWIKLGHSTGGMVWRPTSHTGLSSSST